METMTGSQPTNLPADAQQLHLWILDNQTQVDGLAAALFAVVTTQVGAAAFTFGAVADKVVFVATELACSALEHGLPPTLVCLYRHDADLIIDVADHDIHTPPHGAHLADGCSVGLWLARKNALTIGWYTTDTTRHIWARIPINTTA